jgi:Ecdysteroid kinase-like family
MATTYPAQPDQLTNEWLTTALTDAGALTPGRSVTDFSVTNVGEGIGLLGLVVRANLTYDGDAPLPGPDSIVIKFATPVEANRAVAMNTRMYEREVSFFTTIAPSVDVPMPRCYYAAVDTTTGDNIVALEDLKAYRAGDQVDGIGPDEAKLIIDAIVPLHAAFWGKTDQPLLDNAMRIDSSYVETFPPSLDMTWENCVKLFPHAIAADVLPEVPRYVEGLRGVMKLMGQRTQTLIHGDVRLDNVMFGSGPDQHPVMLIDWQALMVSNPAHDLSYMLTQSLDVEVRRTHEAELVEYYHRALLKHGVPNYTLDQCFDDYDVGMLFLFSYPLIIGGFCDMTPRAVQLAEAILLRSSTALSDRGVLARLDA